MSAPPRTSRDRRRSAGDAAHHHERLRGIGSRTGHFAQAQVHVRSEAAVEGDLAFARREACRPRAVVEKSQVHRFLDLVGTVAA